MNKRLKVCLFIVCLFKISLSQELHILYTQNTNGVLLNCQCPDNPLGGMEKRASFIKRWLDEHPNTLIFDSGDFLSFDGDEVNDIKMLRAMEALNYSAVNIGDQEFSNGIEFIESNMNLSSIPLVASNLELPDDSKLDIPQQRILTVSGLNILVIGVIENESFEFYSRIFGGFNLSVTDPIQAVRRIHTKAVNNSKTDLVILLSNLGYDKDQQLAREMDFINVIIGGHSQHQFEHPVQVGNTIITQCGKNGQYIGHLVINIKKSKLMTHTGELIPMDLSIKDDEAMLKLFAE